LSLLVASRRGISRLFDSLFIRACPATRASGLSLRDLGSPSISVSVNSGMPLTKHYSVFQLDELVAFELRP
jgi:hypothetical protein